MEKLAVFFGPRVEKEAMNKCIQYGAILYIKKKQGCNISISFN